MICAYHTSGKFRAPGTKAHDCPSFVPRSGPCSGCTKGKLYLLIECQCSRLMTIPDSNLHPSTVIVMLFTCAWSSCKVTQYHQFGTLNSLRPLLIRMITPAA